MIIYDAYMWCSYMMSLFFVAGGRQFSTKSEIIWKKNCISKMQFLNRVQNIAKSVSNLLSGSKRDVTIEFRMRTRYIERYIYIHYRIILKGHLRGCFVIGSKEPRLKKQNEATRRFPRGFLEALGRWTPLLQSPPLFEQARTRLGKA